jgi:glucose 1-dehydrogenase
MKPSAMRLAEQVAVVTGAARGIGRGIAICLAEEGADIVIADLPSQVKAAEETARAVEAAGRSALIQFTDVSQRDQVQTLFDMALTRFGRLDIAVSNAAFSIRQPVLETDWISALRTIEVTQFGAFHTAQAASQRLVNQGRGGKIILISSVLYEIPHPHSAAYNMSKAAVHQLTRTLAREMLPHRINVNSINPGWIDTPGERAFTPDDEIQRLAPLQPWGRLGLPRDIGRAAVFLASHDADFITGSSLTVDGGYWINLKPDW